MGTAIAREETPEHAEFVRIYLQDITDCEPLSREEESALFKQARRGDEEAMQRVVRANLRFVVNVARQYTGCGLSLIELIAEGNMGLLEAARRFDETRGFKFITYAVWWIRQAILQALRRSGGVIRRPATHLNDLQRIAKDAGALTQKLGRDPTVDEIAEKVGLSPERVQNARQVSAPGLLSLDAPRFDGSGEPLGSFFVAEETDVEAEFEAAELIGLVRRSLAVLDEREYQIVRTYFGLDAAEPMTLDRIGAMLGLTRERVRQLRDRALDKIRRHCGKQLVEFSDN